MTRFVKAVAHWVGPLAEAGAVAAAIQRFIFDSFPKKVFNDYGRLAHRHDFGDSDD